MKRYYKKNENEFYCYIARLEQDILIQYSVSATTNDDHFETDCEWTFEIEGLSTEDCELVELTEMERFYVNNEINTNIRNNLDNLLTNYEVVE